jgi:hypothetical protein
MRQTPEIILEVCLQYPTHFAPGNCLSEGRQSLVRSHSRPASKRAGKEILLVNGGKHLGGAALERAVGNTGNAQRALFPLARLRDIDSPDVRGLIPFSMHGLKHWFYPYIKRLLCFRYRLSINTRCRLSGNMT